MKKTLLLLVTLLVAGTAFAGWIPDCKYACWMPAFSIDKVWKFSQGYNNTSTENPLLGCGTESFPGAIAWAMMSRKERRANTDDHNMEWAVVYLCDCEKKYEMGCWSYTYRDTIKLCKIVPEGATDDDGWKLYSITNSNYGSTYLAHETERQYDDRCGFLYFVTFYSEEVRQWIKKVQSKPNHEVSVCFKTRWDDNHWYTYSRYSRLDAADATLMTPPTQPSINQVNWCVKNNTATSLTFQTGNSVSNDCDLYIREGDGDPTKIETGNVKYYTPSNMSSRFQSMQNDDYTINLKAYNQREYNFTTTYYHSTGTDNGSKQYDYDVPASRKTAYLRSTEQSFSAPVFVQPKELNAKNNGNGSVTVTWSAAATSASSPDSSRFVLERATDEGFTENPTTKYFYYNPNSTNYSYTDDFNIRNEGNKTFYYRLHREHAAKSEMNISYHLPINTNYANIKSFAAKVNGRKVDLSWDYGNGLITSDMALVITSPENAQVNYRVNAIENDTLRKTFNVTGITECTPTTFRIQAYAGATMLYSPLSSESVTIPSDQPPMIDTFTVSAGYYNNKVDLYWKINNQPFSSFVLYRAEYGDTVRTFLSSVECTEGVREYNYTDNSCVPGVYYQYTVIGNTSCGDVASTVASQATIGFAQSRGAVSGQVLYDGNQASVGVSVSADGTGRYVGKSLLFTPLKSSMLKVPRQLVSHLFNKTQGTVEFFLRVSDLKDNCTILKYKERLALKVENRQLVLQVTNLAGTTSTMRCDSLANDGSFNHIAITYNTESANRRCTFYVNGTVVDSATYTVDGTEHGIIGDTTGVLYFGSNNGTGAFMNGNIDEIRFWNTERSAEQILQTSSTYLNGTESGLTGYYHCDDDVPGLLFDISKTGNSFNGRHLKIEGIDYDTAYVPTREQLSYRTYTDANGHYLFTNVPYSDNGTQYIITPTLGVHEFSPATRPLYFNTTASTHNAVDFTDVSSFEVSGVVYYHNTNYPVEGCQFTIDGITPCTKDGELITTDANGHFTISVPIGKHYINIENGSHTFINGGRYPATGVHDFDRKIENLTFYDSTFVLVTGRVAGGSDEEDKPHGFAQGKANIGKAQIVITPVGSIYDLNLDTANGRTFTMPADSVQGTCLSVATTGPITGGKAKSITIVTDSVTGEFNVMLPPLNYKVDNVKIVNNTDISFGNSLPSLDLSEQEVSQLTTDSTSVDSANWSYFNYAEALDFIYYTYPQLTLSQNDYNNAIGSKEYYYSENNIKDTIPFYTITQDSIRYTFGYPCFFQGDVHTWKLTVAEYYVNYDNRQHPDTTRQPLRYGVVTVDNNYGTQCKNRFALMDTTILYGSQTVSVSGGEMMLDSAGRTYYTFMVGEPVVTAPYTATAQIIFEDAERTREYDWNGNSDLESIVFGSRMQGSQMVTKGPDEIFYVLRDPPGAHSYATLQQGETVTKSKYSSKGMKREADIEWCYEWGYGLNVAKGSLIQIETDVFDKDNSIGPYLHYEGSSQWYDKQNWEFTNEETVTTSDDEQMVGSIADVYIGKAKNLIYGDADKVCLLRDTAGNYTVGKSNVFAMGEELTTQFHYSQFYIENSLIPNLKSVRASLLTQVTASQYNENYPKSVNTQYITTRSASDSDFGEDSTYIMIPPQNTTETFVLDSVSMINRQIKAWEKAMADNERAKVMVHHSTTNFNQDDWETVVYGGYSEDGLFNQKGIFAKSIDSTWNTIDSVAAQYSGGWLVGNYSVGGGASFSQSQTRRYNAISNGTIEENDFVVGVDYNRQLLIKGNGRSLSFKAGIGGVFSSESSIDSLRSTVVSYNVLTNSLEGLSFDVYEAPDGYGPIFSTRAGQTYCPYEGEDETKYYEPGSELHTATVPMADPTISAVNNRAVNVPVGQTALFNVTLANAASTNQQVDFRLCVDPATNPNGAVVRMDGTPLTFDGVPLGLAGGQSTNKVLEIEQVRQDVLEYDSIMVIFRSGCYQDDADTVYLTAHFVPTCSDVNLTVDRTTINNTTDSTARFTISGFTPDFHNFSGVQLQYQRQGDVNWTTLETWQAASLQDVTAVNYSMKFGQANYPGGTYLFRAVTLCQWGNETINNESDVVTVVVDVKAPSALGEPYPIDGIYNSVSQVYVDFSEPIQTDRVLGSNVTVEGVLNSHPIDHSVSLDLENNSVYSSATYLLDSVPFSLEMWIKYTEPGTLFSYAASQGNGVTFSINANHKLTATFNGASVVSTDTIPVDQWCYLLIKCDPVTHNLNAYCAYDSYTVTLFSEVNVPLVSSRGNVMFGGNGLKAKVHDVALWSTLRPWATALSERSVSKTAYTPNLISLWRMDEGKGKKAADCIRHRDLVLTADAWAYNYTNYALHIPARSTATVDISECPIAEGQGWMFEFWFRAMGDAELFRLSNDSIRVSVTNGYLNINNQSFVIRDYTDSTWHHLAIIDKNTARPVVAIDGVQVSTYLLSRLPNFSAASIVFGADTSTTHDIDIDEIRLWQVNTTLDVARLYRNTCMRGTEDGLKAYYPMEHTILDAYNQNVTLFTNLDKTAADTLTAKRIAIGDVAGRVSTSSPALIESRPTEYVAHTITTSDDRVVINITESDARIEGCTLEFTVKNIVDQNGNYSQPIRWSAFVNRNQLLWDEDVISVVKDELVDTTFNLVIVNNGSQAKSWSIDNAPTWMSLSQSSGTIQPLQRETLTCTINSSLGRGEDEYILYLTSDDNIDRPLYLETKVYANRPNWTVDPTEYSSSMNLITCAEINGVLADDPEDMIGAFIGTELVGVAHLQLFPAYGRYVAMMTIYDGSDSEDRNITFRYWDASNGMIYSNIRVYCTTPQSTDSLVNPFQYNSESIYGTIRQPYLLRMGTEVEQQLDMSRGWNWISMNVMPYTTLAKILWSPYVSYVADYKSQSDFVQADTINNRFVGTLDSIDFFKGYRLKANRKFTAKFTGTPVPISSTFAVAANSWTWIGYIPQSALTVDAALSNINPTVGDIIKSQREFATWDGSTWLGTLTVMEPGKGYSYHNTSSSPILFSYPDYSGFSYLPARMPAQIAESHFDPIDPGKYQGNMTMTAIVKYDDAEVDDAEIGVFAGDECRAVSSYSDGYYFLTIPGEGSVEMTVKVFYNDSIYTLAEGFTYGSDSALGDIYNPYVINLNTKATSVVSVEADAEGDKVEKVLINNEVFIIRNGEWYDMTGRRRERPVTK